MLIQDRLILQLDTLIQDAEEWRDDLNSTGIEPDHWESFADDFREKSEAVLSAWEELRDQLQIEMGGDE